VNSGEREAWSNERGDHNEEEGRTMSSLMVDFIISLDGYASADRLARLLGHGGT